MVRCSRSAQQCLTSVAGFALARFVAAWSMGKLPNDFCVVFSV